MKKLLILLFMMQLSILASGQIVADHTVVAEYDKIPQRWIDSVKSMWLVMPGESHVRGNGYGLEALETFDPKFQVNYISYSGTPASYTESNLRMSHLTWGDVNNSSGWQYLYGEEDWYQTPTAISRTKAGITFCNTNDLMISAIGFGWCWDPAETDEDMPSYIEATKEYIQHCIAEGYKTNVFFSTGPVDGSNAEGGTGWNKYLAYEVIRDSVANDESRILFDFADILCYDDEATSPNTTTWNGNEYPIITDNNYLPTVNEYHLSEYGTLRLAKALWWMLARIAGWDGSVSTGSDDVTSNADLAIIRVLGEELRIELKEPANLPSRISIHNLKGNTVLHKDYPGSICSFNIVGIPAGLYLVVLSGPGINKTQKIFIQ